MMQWLEISIQTTPDTIDETVTALTAGGFSDLVIEDQAEFESFLNENRDYWDYIDESLQKQLEGLSRIKLYLQAQDQESLVRLQQLLQGLGAPQMQVTEMPQTDWEESWKDSYPPQKVGQRLVVLPYWLAEDYREQRLPIILDPGLTFGTGAHPSTQMVMQTMEQLIRPGMQCLDLGSGSGILSITALRLGAGTAVGVDIDPKAEDIARENAAYNGFGSPAFTALTGNVTADKRLMEQLRQDRYDLVLVNIVADVIISLAPVLPGFMDADTVLVCSGILDTRLQQVCDALEQSGLQILQIMAQEDWRCVRAKRR